MSDHGHPDPGTDAETFDVTSALKVASVIDPTAPVEMTAGFYRGLLERIATLEEKVLILEDTAKSDVEDHQ